MPEGPVGKKGYLLLSGKRLSREEDAPQASIHPQPHAQSAKDHMRRSPTEVQAQGWLKTLGTEGSPTKPPIPITPEETLDIDNCGGHQSLFAHLIRKLSAHWKSPGPFPSHLLRTRLSRQAKYIFPAILCRNDLCHFLVSIVPVSLTSSNIAMPNKV